MFLINTLTQQLCVHLLVLQDPIYFVYLGAIMFCQSVKQNDGTEAGMSQTESYVDECGK